MRRALAFPVLALLALALPALAEEPAYSAAYGRCMDKSEGATFPMIDCMTEEEGRWDKLLNRNYQAVLGQLTPNRQKSLRAAQRLWLQYRTANCSFYLDPDGGQAARIGAAGCALTMTAQRAREIARFLD